MVSLCNGRAVELGGVTLYYPALGGALIYLSNTGDVVLGGSALFFLALGMGVPLMVVGGSGGHWLPPRRWLDGYGESGLRCWLIGVAIWLLARLLPAGVVLLLWGVLLIGCGVYLGALAFAGKPQTNRGMQVIGVVAFVWGVMCVIGAGAGGRDPLQPLSGLAGGVATTAEATDVGLAAGQKPDRCSGNRCATGIDRSCWTFTLTGVSRVKQWKKKCFRRRLLPRCCNNFTCCAPMSR